MIRSMNRPGDQSNIFHPSNVQRQKHVQHGSLIKMLIVQVLASATQLFIVVIKTLTEDLFSMITNH